MLPTEASWNGFQRSDTHWNSRTCLVGGQERVGLLPYATKWPRFEDVGGVPAADRVAIEYEGKEVYRGPPTACSKLNKDDYTQNTYVCVAAVDRGACRPGVVRVTMVSEPAVVCL